MGVVCVAMCHVCCRKLLMHVDPSGPTYQINLEGVAKEAADDPTDKGYVLCSNIMSTVWAD